MCNQEEGSCLGEFGYIFVRRGCFGLIKVYEQDTINIYVIILIATLAQGGILIVALFTSKQSNKTANSILVGLIIIFWYYIGVKMLYNTGEIHNYVYLIRTHSPLVFLFGVFLYLYIKALTSPNFRLTPKHSVHLIPFGLYILFSLPFFLFADSATKLEYALEEPPSLEHWIGTIAQLAVALGYLVFSYKLLLRHQQSMKDMFSNLERVKLNWLRNLVVTFAITWLASPVRHLVGLEKQTEFLTPLLLCLTVYLIGFYALKQPEIFKDIHLDLGENQSKQTADLQPMYTHSGLTSQDLATHKDRLIAYLEAEKPYVNSDLKLQDLADYLEIPAYQVSQVINAEMKRNFYDLINAYRIEEARRQLLDPAKQHLTILAIAYDVGFNSKSAFNTAFKKYTHMTPSQYKHSQLSSSQS